MLRREVHFIIIVKNEGIASLQLN